MASGVLGTLGRTGIIRTSSKHKLAFLCERGRWGGWKHLRYVITHPIYEGEKRIDRKMSLCPANKGRTDVDAPAGLLLAVDEVLHPMYVVEAQGDGGDEALQRDLDAQAKVLLQQGAGQGSHCLWFLEIHPVGKKNGQIFFFYPSSLM